jgi:hypothetical protein
MSAAFFRLDLSVPADFNLMRCGRGGHLLNFRQSPDCESNDLNHSESKFVLQTVNETEVGVRETNGGGFKSAISHRCHFYNITDQSVVALRAARKQRDS